SVSITFSEVVSLTVTRIERDVFDANPGALIVTVYVPGSNRGTRNTPSDVVVTERERSVASLTASTFAFATTRLLGSYAMPEIAPVPGVCPEIGSAAKSSAITGIVRQIRRKAVFIGL